MNKQIEEIKETEKDKIINILKNNGVLAIPTDTVYGLTIKSEEEDNYYKLLKIKNRPSEKLFPIIVSSIKQIEKIAYIDDLSRYMIKRFMPGPITIILKKKGEIFSYLNSETIAVRMAEEGYLKEVIKEIGMPLWLTSANKSGMKTSINSKDVLEQLSNEIDGIIVGLVKGKIPSTIVEFKDNNFKIHREGPISEEDIQIELAKYLKEYAEK